MFLEKDNINFYEAYDGEMALMIVERYEIDLAIIDIMMPRMNGFELLKNIRKKLVIPVMFLSARVQLDDKVLGLDLGADDYITKPFEPLEVAARVKANLRRHDKSTDHFGTENEDILICKDMQLDLNRCLLQIGEDVLNVTKIELSLLELFMRHPGRVFTKEQLYRCGWEDMYVVDDNTIRVTISRLRDKIGGDRIKTIRGLGYRLEI